MKKLLACICLTLFSTAALAEMPLNTWMDGLEYRGTQIEVIRVASQKPLVAIEETDAEVDRILKEAEALEDETDDYEKVEDSS